MQDCCKYTIKEGLAPQVQDEKEVKGSPVTQPKPLVEEYGPWMVISRRKSTTKNNPKGAGYGSSQSDITQVGPTLLI